ncbi:hypothetical protein FSHL1_006884 [Fusarium sambucinum]
MLDLFATLDNIQFDFQSFTLQRLEDKYSEDMDRSPTLPTSECIKNFLESSSTDGVPSQHMESSFYVIAPYSSALSKLCTANDEIKNTETETREILQDRVHAWLSQLPDQARVIPPLSMKPHDYKNSVPNPLLHQEREPLVEATWLSDTLTVVESNGQTLQGHNGENNPYEFPTSVNHGGVLDYYHSALLNIHMASTPIGGFNSKFRPSVRRRYPRGAEEEACLSIDASFNKEKKDIHHSR